MPQLIRSEHAPGSLGRIKRATVALVRDEDRFAREAGIEFDKGKERRLAIGGHKPDVRGSPLPTRRLGGGNSGVLKNVPQRDARDGCGIRGILGDHAQLMAGKRAKIGCAENDLARTVTDAEGTRGDGLRLESREGNGSEEGAEPEDGTADHMMSG